MLYFLINSLPPHPNPIGVWVRRAVASASGVRTQREKPYEHSSCLVIWSSCNQSSSPSQVLWSLQHTRAQLATLTMKKHKHPATDVMCTYTIALSGFRILIYFLVDRKALWLQMGTPRAYACFLPDIWSLIYCGIMLFSAETRNSINAI